MSLPSWERGLKLFFCRFLSQQFEVAPLVGAWIETISGYYRLMLDGGRSPRGSVD